MPSGILKAIPSPAQAPAAPSATLPKRRTRAMIAREKGLEPLANVILLQNLKEPVEKAAEAYISVEKGVESVQDAINGAL